jgi:hypothetical protein
MILAWDYALVTLTRNSEESTAWPREQLAERILYPFFHVQTIFTVTASPRCHWH